MSRYLYSVWTRRRIDRYSARLHLQYLRCIKLSIQVDSIDVLELIARWIYFDNKCCFCADGRRTVQVDHLVAVSKGGGHVLKNLFPCCKRCNRFKSSKDWKAWYAAQDYFLPERLEKINIAIDIPDPGNHLPKLKERAK